MSARRVFPPAGWLSRECSSRPVALALAAVFVQLFFYVSAAIAQDEKGDDDEALPPAVEMDGKPGNQAKLITRDGVELAATYYPGTKGRETVPIILLHIFRGNRNDFSELAPYLQSLGHAVLVPDLRGHGDSTSVRGARVPLQADILSPTQFGRMVRFDMERLKYFLLQKNNAGELNIEKLCIVGGGMGASVAMTWARLDWNRPPVGNRKQGQDVKALVLLSPEMNTPGLPLAAAVSERNLLTLKIWDPQLQKVLKYSNEMDFTVPVRLDFRAEVSMLIVVGKSKSKSVRYAKRLHTMVQHPRTVLKRHFPDVKVEKDLFYGALDTSLQGTKMLGARGLNLEQTIGKFIDLRLVRRALPWKARQMDPYSGQN